MDAGDWSPNRDTGTDFPSARFTDADVAVRERGFRGKGEKLTHVCAVVIDDNTTLFGSTDEETGDAVIWRLDAEGNLARTAAFLNGSAKPVTNETFYAQFVSERDYFLRKAQTSSGKPAGASTCPASVIRDSTPPKAAKAGAADAELSVLFLDPWLVPVIIRALVVGMRQPSRRTRGVELRRRKRC